MELFDEEEKKWLLTTFLVITYVIEFSPKIYNHLPRYDIEKKNESYRRLFEIIQSRKEI